MERLSEDAALHLVAKISLPDSLPDVDSMRSTTAILLLLTAPVMASGADLVRFEGSDGRQVYLRPADICYLVEDVSGGSVLGTSVVSAATDETYIKGRTAIEIIRLISDAKSLPLGVGSKSPLVLEFVELTHQSNGADKVAWVHTAAVAGVIAPNSTNTHTQLRFLDAVSLEVHGQTPDLVFDALRHGKRYRATLE